MVMTEIYGLGMIYILTNILTAVKIVMYDLGKVSNTLDKAYAGKK